MEFSVMSEEHVKGMLFTECDTDGRDGSFPDSGIRARGKFERKNNSIINNFLGQGKRFRDVCILPRYYGECWPGSWAFTWKRKTLM
jgi:hypothetical protein